MQTEERVFRQVPVNIVDLTAAPDGEIKPGFYFNIPLSADEEVMPGEMFLDGPHVTRDDALCAATEFISNALKDWRVENAPDTGD